MNGRASPFAAGTILHLHGAELATSGTPLACPDWSIAAGDAWFVAGGAGTGKTTLLRAIAGLESPAAGRIEFLGADWANLSEGAGLDYRRRIGIVLCQGAGLFHQFTVLENIELPLRYHGGLSSGQVRDRARALMAALKLERFSDAPSVRLPPGVARRVQLARALAMDPEVLLLDDPCS
ncbi:MAG TPA: hypothetical protein DCY13_12925, partial [Verrucomicrobiales bacterium]|nr:hypothetical protein [Verrucomicrobiales bacterium]